VTPWDFSGAPELREALIDLLADALVAYVERQEAEASTGVTPGGINQAAEKPRCDEHLANRHSAGVAVGAGSTPAPGVAPGDAENVALAAVPTRRQAAPEHGVEAVGKGD